MDNRRFEQTLSYKPARLTGLNKGSLFPLDSSVCGSCSHSSKGWNACCKILESLFLHRKAKYCWINSHSAGKFEIKFGESFAQEQKRSQPQFPKLSFAYLQCLTDGNESCLEAPPNFQTVALLEQPLLLVMHSEFTHVTVASWTKTCVKWFMLKTGIKCQQTKWGNNNKVGGHQGRILCWISQQQAARVESKY